ncbi:MAG: hypothetical protein ACQEUY_02800 [Pseudomonadota bacterium]
MMIKKDSLKKLGIVGVSFALMSSPFAFADMHEKDHDDAMVQEETDENNGTRQQSDLDDDQGAISDTEGDGSSRDATVTQQETDENTGTRQQSDLDEDQDSMGDDGSAPDADVVQEEVDENNGTRQQSDLDED